MVERVAKAIALEHEGSDLDWPSYLEEARAAIAEMREPTEAMEDAAFREGNWRYVWRAMIDAALSPQKEKMDE